MPRAERQHRRAAQVLGAELAQQHERRVRIVDDEALEPRAEYRFDGGLEPVLGVERARQQAAHAAALALGQLLEQGTRAQRLAALGLAQRLELRGDELQALARSLELARQLALALATPFERAQRLGELAPVVVALGQPLAEPRLETFLAQAQLLDLLRPGLDRLFVLAQAQLELAAPLLDPVLVRLGRRLVGGQLDQARVQRLAPALRRGEPLGVLGELAVAARQLGLVGAHALFQLGQPRQRVAQLARVAREPHLQLAQLGLALVGQRDQARALAALVADLALERLDRAAHRVERLARARQLALLVQVRAARDLEVRVGAARARVEPGALGAQVLERALGARELGRVAAEALARDDELELAQLGAQLLVAVRLGGLPVERGDLAPELDQDVVHAQQVLLGRAQL